MPSFPAARRVFLTLVILLTLVACTATGRSIAGASSSRDPSPLPGTVEPTTEPTASLPAQAPAASPTPTRIRESTATGTRAAQTTATTTAITTGSKTATLPAAARGTATPGPLVMPPVVPVIDGTIKARLRALYLKGQALGNRAGVFIKVGDSISESSSFLVDIGCKTENLGTYADLAPTIDYFRQISLPPDYTDAWCESANSFSRSSLAAQGGWTSDAVLAPLNPPRPECPGTLGTPLRCELSLLRPSIALIMLGTNDVGRNDPPGLAQRNLELIVSQVLAEGVIPVLSTIPPRTSGGTSDPRVAAYNQAIRELADKEQVPLWNYWLALQQPGMINQGMDTDGIHPSVYQRDHSVDLTTEGLRYGYNQRNLTALQVLDKLKRVIIDDGPPDSP